MNDLFDEVIDTEIKKLPFDLPNVDGFSSQWDESRQGFIIQIPNGVLFYAPQFFSQKISDRSVEYFLENDTYEMQKVDWSEIQPDDLKEIKFHNILWKQDFINLYGKKIPLPRLTSWYGDDGKAYKYSGILSQPNPWNKGLLYIKERIEKVSGTQFNSVLMNWYRNGEDYLNWHTDDEPELGKNPTIASVNFGETRDFQVRHKDDHQLKFTVPLQHGSLLIMSGEMQHFWQHSVPKRKKVQHSRFNLTFRMIRD
ncbi:alpha-ketoglutarate-dependent dioxygenase AlkB family protein [Acinetobacter baumannii]|uniref:alpha-ketoglutarate-dependent dioxygenase AlkB family protein n=1 Tax=Acinetobacter baumannii TaxID=470 RepID=UPI003B437992